MQENAMTGENTPEKKYEKLRQIFLKLGRVVAAYSGGADSSLLIYTAREILGKDNVLAVTANSETYVKEELDFTEEFTARYDIEHKVITTCELEEINRHGNTKNRCYYCKRELFSVLRNLAAEGHYTVIEGSNMDDEKDYRPGSRAREELKIRSPLAEAGFTKEDIRTLSRQLGLPTWDKPAYACLTSRFPYNMEIGKPDLEMVAAAEKFLHELGFRQCRVRHYGTKARVEVETEKVPEAEAMASRITGKLQQIGYKEVEIDPEGYRMGSMNVFR